MSVNDGTWDPVDTIFESTGTINFALEGSRSKRAKYVCLSADTPPEIVFRLLTEAWELGHPKLVISVQGDCDQSPNLKRTLHKGLIGATNGKYSFSFCLGLLYGILRHL